MALFELIEWNEMGNDEIVHRFPETGSAETRLGSQLVVRESQAAVFFRDGKALDIFSAGRHVLTTANLPILSKIIGLAFEDRKSPFRCEVYFVSLKVFSDMKWGTKEPIPVRDTELGLVRLRAFGSYTMRVNDPLVFVNTLVGQRGRYSSADINGYLRDAIVSRMADILGENVKSVFDLAALYDELASAAKVRTGGDFSKYGMELIDFFVQAVTPPEEVQKMIDQRSAMGAVGDMDRFMRFKAAQSMEKAAENPGGGMGAAMGLGMGAGLGAMMPQMMQNAVAAQPAAAQPAAGGTSCPKCQTANAPGAKFCAGCGASLATAGKKCTACGFDIPAGAKFCPNCGAKTAVATHCPSCGIVVEAGAKFCGGCGAKLA